MFVSYPTNGDDVWRCMMMSSFKALISINWQRKTMGYYIYQCLFLVDNVMAVQSFICSYISRLVWLYIPSMYIYIHNIYIYIMYIYNVYIYIYIIQAVYSIHHRDKFDGQIGKSSIGTSQEGARGRSGTVAEKMPWSGSSWRGFNDGAMWGLNDSWVMAVVVDWLN